jgi:hypothetical protein
MPEEGSAMRRFVEIDTPLEADTLCTLLRRMNDFVRFF